jgi:hypothetical protein
MLPELILALRDGKVTESGTHGALLSQGRFYARLVDYQMAGVAAQSFGHNCVAPKVFLKAMNTNKKG